MKKIKLRDMTPEQWERISDSLSFCLSHPKCEDCPFLYADCSMKGESSWFNHKDMYSDKFLDQEIEVEE